MKVNPGRYGTYQEMMQTLTEYAGALDIEHQLKSGKHLISLNILNPKNNKCLRNVKRKHMSKYGNTG